jgi:hypothetical protein
MRMVVFLIGLVVVFSGSAQATSGNELLSRCKAQNHERTWCLGYLQGFHNGLVIADALGLRLLGGTSVYCMPPNVTVGQIVDVVVRFLEQNPAIRHENAEWLTLAALTHAFPCQTTR